MRIDTLWIEKFKNLRNLEISFEDYLTTVLIGENGTGKSNLLEAIAIIFRDLDLELKNSDTLQFEYYIEYECRGRQIKIDANPNQPRRSVEQKTLFADAQPSRRKARLLITVDGKRTSMKEFFENKREYLPNHVFGYYSGPTNRLAQHFEHHQRLFYDQQRSPDNKGDRPLRPLFFALPVHSQFVLLAFFTFPDEKDRDILRDYIGIAELDSVMFIIREPDWARASSSEDPYWGCLLYTSPSPRD